MLSRYLSISLSSLCVAGYSLMLTDRLPCCTGPAKIARLLTVTSNVNESKLVRLFQERTKHASYSDPTIKKLD